MLVSWNRVGIILELSHDRVATLPGNMEKPGIWQFSQEKLGKTWSLRYFEKTGKTWNLKNLEKNLEKPRILNKNL